MPLRPSRLLALVTATALALPVLSATTAVAAPRALDAGCPDEVVRDAGLLDVAGSVHDRGIDCLVHWGVAAGTSLSRYAPSAAVTRGQMATFLFRAVQRSGGTLPAAAPDAFDDDAGSVHEDAVNALAAAGVVNGRGPRRYEPAATVSRAQAAALLVRAFDERAEASGQQPLPPGPDAFPDDDGTVLEDETDRAAAAGLVGGYPDGRYRPSAAVTREAMASTVARWLDLAVSRGLGAVPARAAAVRSVAVGDIACRAGSRTTRTTCQHAATADLAEALAPEGVLLLGDLQYATGSVEEFSAAGGFQGTWSRLLDRSWPTAGNHEWDTPGAQGYRSAFDGRTGGRFWYSFDLGGWHVVSLDSNCGEVGGCGPGSPVHQFLVDDLAAHDGRPTVVFWHHPRWSTGGQGSSSSVASLWRTAEADDDVQVVLSGHDHSYERFAPLDGEGRLAADGLESIVSGTGGKSLDCSREPGAAGSVVFDCSSAGVLLLSLRPDGWDFEQVGTDGQPRDAGSRPLRRAAP